nr:hypothetical protein [Actinomycetes bacterium]
MAWGGPREGGSVILDRPPTTLRNRSAWAGTARVRSGSFETANTASTQAIRLFPAALGRTRNRPVRFQRSQVQILPPLRISGSESTDSEPESI